jgi:hypothetical protein
MVERFKDFIQDNDAKRSRAHMKQSAEEDSSTKLQVELSALQEQHEGAQSQREALEAELSRLERYAVYMDSVVAQRQEEYAETSSIHQRWRTLSAFHSKHQASVAATQGAADKQRQRVQELRRETEDKVLALSASVQEHTEALGGVRASLAETQEAAEAAASQRGEFAKESKMVMTSIRNMYQRCKAKAPKSYPTVRLSTLPKQHELAECLAVICTRMLDLQTMVRDYGAWKQAQEAAAVARVEEKRRAAADGALPRAAGAADGALPRAAGASGREGDGALHGRRGGGTGRAQLTSRSGSSLHTAGPPGHMSSAASLLSSVGAMGRAGRNGPPQAKLAPGLSTANLPPGTAVATTQAGVFAIRIGGAGQLSPGGGPSGGSPQAAGSGGLGMAGSAGHLASSSLLY